MTDIQIAQSAKMLPIKEIATTLGIHEHELDMFGRHKAKLNRTILTRIKHNPDGKLILVTAINPTPAGEGKTTITVALGQALSRIGKRAIITLREPSLGPVMGIKGGAAGGGYSQVVPMEDINLHFTGDIHAVTAANNLLSALIENHIYQGNSLNIDTICHRRAADMNDRSLRSSGYQITAASEVMAVLCLANDIDDLKIRLGQIVAAKDADGNPITAADLGAAGAMTLLLKDAVMPNLVQTLENTPCLMHGGPFANIAHGCNTVIATRAALKLADYCVTEAGFGADLGAEKFFDIKCRTAGLTPSAAVIVATVRALKHHGNGNLEEGIVNLGAHIENVKKFGVPPIVALNVFGTDTPEELAFIKDYCSQYAVPCERCDGFSKGGEGAEALAEIVCQTAEIGASFTPLYDLNLSTAEKISKIAFNIYGAEQVDFSCDVSQFDQYKLPVCIAKTQYSLSDDPTLLGRPDDFTITVRESRLCAGAGFIVAFLGNILTMPGLPKKPAAEGMDIDYKGNIVGLF